MLLLAVVAGIVTAAPLAYIAVRALGGGIAVWAGLWQTQIPRLLLNSLVLAFTTTALSAAVAIPMAWLVVRSDLPGRRLWRWLAALPLVFPAFIGAFAYISVFGPRGFMEEVFSRALGIPVTQVNLINLYGLAGTTLVLSLFTYPYLYLLVVAALGNMNRSLEDAARIAGLPPLAVIRRVTLPTLKPAIGAGAMLVGFHTLADFGTVAMLRYDTFTSAIYLQLIGRYDRAATAALSSVLVGLTLLFLWAETRWQLQARFYQTTGTWRPPDPVPLGRWRWPALAFVVIVLLHGLAVPVAMLVFWSVRGLAQGADLRLWQYTVSTVTSSGLAATLALVLAFPVAYIATRSGGRASLLLYRLAFAGYALPGVVVALGLIFIFNRYLPWAYGTVWVMVVAYIVRFMPECLGAQHSALAQVSPNLEEASRSSGLSVWATLRRVTLPLVLPGFAAGWSLVFLNSLKELAATLLVRPAGYDTLAVRVWIYASEGFYPLAAPPALMLVLLAVPPLIILVGRILEGRTGLT